MTDPLQMTPLADRLTAYTVIEANTSLTWITATLTQSEQRVLTDDDLRRMDVYAGAARDLHEMLPAVLPLAPKSISSRSALLLRL